MATEDAVRDALLAQTRPAPDALRVGPGDDAAVVSLEPWAGADLVVTSDGLEEGVHFRRAWQDSRDLAWKLLAVNLSDLAAVGAEPIGYQLDVSWPRRWPLVEAMRLGEALRNAEDHWALTLWGGDTDMTEGPLRLTATLFGRVEPPGPIRRSGAAVGDTIFVSGPLGGAAAFWTAREDAAASGSSPPAVDETVADAVADDGAGDDTRNEALKDSARRFRRPVPRLELGLALRGRASAAMDLSDGLVIDLRRLARASGVAAEIDLSEVPIHPAARLSERPNRLALFGGEDYELLACGPASLASEIPGLHAIGRVVAGEPGHVEVRRPQPAHGEGAS